MAGVLKFEKRAREEEIPVALREFIDAAIVPALVREYLAEGESANLLAPVNCDVANIAAMQLSACEVSG